MLKNSLFNIKFAKIMKAIWLIIIGYLFFYSTITVSQQERVFFSDTWGNEGITVEEQSSLSVKLNFSISSFTIRKVDKTEKEMSVISLPGDNSVKKEGYPNLPSITKYIAVPQGAKVSINIIASRTEVYKNIDIAPAQAIRKEDDEDRQVQFVKNETIYSENAFYPLKITKMSEIKNIRGVDACLLNICPFQYNPVTKELIVYRDLKIDIVFSGSNGQFGDVAFRSRWFDPLLKDLFINNESLPTINYNYKSIKDDEDFEYIIISPDIPEYLQWADSIKKFRTIQGIRTQVVSLTELGGNYVDSIENYIDNAYNNWTIKPVGVLFIGDYGEEGLAGDRIVVPLVFDDNTGSWIYTDNKYADVNNDHLPEIIVSRMSVQNANELENIVSKVIRYERQPPIAPDFYNTPLFATRGGYDWYLLHTEVVRGFMVNELNKNPETEYVPHISGPPNAWTTEGGDYVDLFGPNGLGYIEADPTYVTDYTGSTQGIINAINDGAFFAMHRDHGMENGWVHPSFTINDLPQLDNDMLTYIFSINCYTGAFVKWDGNTDDCFAEAIHKHEKGAVGVIAAISETYQHFNEVYSWGVIDYMWPGFMPNNSSTPEPRGIMPAFANVAGKYRLEETSIPDEEIFQKYMIDMYHYFGDVFSTMYSEVPQQLTVVYNNTINPGQTFFTIKADEGALIGITANEEIIGTATATGQSQNIDITPQNTGDVIHVCVTKQNYFRFEADVNVGITGLTEPDDLQNIASVYPNPFSKELTISLNLPESSKVNISVFDMMGKRVKLITNKQLTTGSHEINWNGCNETGQRLSKGLYLLKIKTNRYSYVDKILITD